MRIEKHTIQWRLWMWGQWVQEPRTELSQTFSPFGRYAEMQENSAIRPDGIVYEIIDGTPCPPDGGLSNAVARRAGLIMHNQRCKDVNEAIGWLPAQMRKIITETYVVPNRGEPRSAALVAARMGLACPTVKESRREAHRKLAARIYGSFEVLELRECEVAA